MRFYGTDKLSKPSEYECWQVIVNKLIRESELTDEKAKMIIALSSEGWLALPIEYQEKYSNYFQLLWKL